MWRNDAEPLRIFAVRLQSVKVRFRQLRHESVVFLAFYITAENSCDGICQWDVDDGIAAIG